MKENKRGEEIKTHIHTDTQSSQIPLSLTLSRTHTGGMARQLCYLIGDNVYSKEEERRRLRQEIGDRKRDWKKGKIMEKE